MAKKKSKKKDFQLTDEGLGEYIFNSIIKDVRDLKSQVIDNIYSNERKALSKPQDFLTKINDFLKFWYNYGKRTADLIESQGVSNKSVDNLKYDYVKKFMFGNYDFKSILLYVDGMIKHIYEEKSYDKDKLNDFYKYTLKTAYGMDEMNPTSLLTDLEVNDNMEIPSDGPEFDINMLSDYEIFKENDYTDLFKAIEGVVDFIGQNKMKRLFEIKKYLNNKLLTSFAVKSIFDYIEFSLYLYAIRMYVVSRFLSGFVDRGEKPDPFSESVINEDDVVGSFLKRMVIFKLDIVQAHWYGDSIFASMDELNVRSLDKTKFFKLFKTFLDVHAIKYSDKPIMNDAFIKEYSKYFKDSQVFDFFMKQSIPDSIDEYYLKLKYLIHVPNMGLLTSEKPIHNHKTRFFDMLIKMGCGSESLFDCKKGAVLIYYFMKIFLEQSVKNQLSRINTLACECPCRSMIKPSDVTTVKKLYSEMNNFLSGFYDELSFMCFKVVQYLENKIFYYEHEMKRTGLKKDDTAEPENNLIRPVGQNFDQIYWDDQSVFNENSVFVHMYPFYENMQLYYKYLHSLPEFQELGLFTEDFSDDVGNAVDKTKETVQKGFDGFIAWINSLWEKIREWFGNATVQGCFKWVKDHRSEFGNHITETSCPSFTINNAHLYRRLHSENGTELDFIKKLTDEVKNYLESGQDTKEQDEKTFDEIIKNYAGPDKPLPLCIETLATSDVDLAKRVVKIALFYDKTKTTTLFSASKVDETFVDNLEKTLVVNIEGGEAHAKEVKTYIDICLDNVDTTSYEAMRKLLNDTSTTVKNCIDALKKRNINEAVSSYLNNNSSFRYFQELNDPAQPSANEIQSSEKDPVSADSNKEENKNKIDSQSSGVTPSNNNPTNSDTKKINIDKSKEKLLSMISSIIIAPTMLYLSTWISNQYKILTGVYKNLPKSENK